MCMACVWKHSFSTSFREAAFFFFFPDNPYSKDEDRGESKPFLSSCCFRTPEWRQSRSVPGRADLHMVGRSVRRAQGSSERTVRHPEPPVCTQRRPRHRGASCVSQPSDLWKIRFKLQVSREPCVFPGLLPHGAKVKCCHLLTHTFDTAVVGITRGFYGFYLIKSGWRKRSWNMEVGHTLCGTKWSTGKELYSLIILETSVALSGFGLIITSSSFYQAVWFCNRVPPTPTPRRIEFY